MACRTAMIRTTLVAMPRRSAVLAAKAVIVGGLVLTAGTSPSADPCWPGGSCCPATGSPPRAASRCSRHRRAPDLTPDVRAWFAASGFDEVAFDAVETSTLAGVGVHRLRQAPAAGLPDEPLFTFREE
jgi:hypothetical protein